MNQAGELGANLIYEGQYAILKRDPRLKPLIRHMWDQEVHHLETFNKLVAKHRIRPTALRPLWNIAGYTLGVGTALLGEKAAMACTEAIETEIGGHYNDQLRTLLDMLKDDQDLLQNGELKELIDTIREFRDDELEQYVPLFESKFSKNTTNRNCLALILLLSMTRRALKVTTSFSMLSEVDVRLLYGSARGFDIQMPSKLYIMFGQVPTCKYCSCSFIIRPVHRVLMPLPIQSRQESNRTLAETFFHYKFLASWAIVELARMGELRGRGCTLFSHIYAIPRATIQVPPCTVPIPHICNQIQ